jgi:hypothetical protein
MSARADDAGGANLQRIRRYSTRNVTFLRQRLDGFWGEELAFFQQAAEIFFAGVAMLAFAAVEVLEDFISDLEAFKVHDADIFVAVFPDLSLLEFQRHGILEIRLSGFHLRRDGRGRSYFFLPAACLPSTAAFFFAAALVTLDCFWPDFFWFAFGDLSPMMLPFFLPRLTRPRNKKFPRRHVHHAWRGGECKRRASIHFTAVNGRAILQKF